MPRLLFLWTSPGMAAPPLPWAAPSVAEPLFQWRFSPVFNLNLPRCNLRPFSLLLLLLPGRGDWSHPAPASCQAAVESSQMGQAFSFPGWTPPVPSAGLSRPFPSPAVLLWIDPSTSKLLLQWGAQSLKYMLWINLFLTKFLLKTMFVLLTNSYEG